MRNQSQLYGIARFKQTITRYSLSTGLSLAGPVRVTNRTLLAVLAVLAAMAVSGCSTPPRHLQGVLLQLDIPFNERTTASAVADEPIPLIIIDETVYRPSAECTGDQRLTVEAPQAKSPSQRRATRVARQPRPSTDSNNRSGGRAFQRDTVNVDELAAARERRNRHRRGSHSNLVIEGHYTEIQCLRTEQGFSVRHPTDVIFYDGVRFYRNDNEFVFPVVAGESAEGADNNTAGSSPQ